MNARITMQWNLLLQGKGVATGFSESFYKEVASLQVGVNEGELLAGFRKFCLPKGASIFAVKATDVANPGVVRTGSQNIIAPDTHDTDTPWQCLLLDGNADAGNRRNVYLHAVPDDQITDGEYDPGAGYAGRVSAFKNYLVAREFMFKGQVKSAAKTELTQVVRNDDTTATGKYKGTQLLTEGMEVTAYRSRDIYNQSIRGKMTVLAVDATAKTITFGPYTRQDANRVLLRRVLFDYFPFSDVRIDRMIIKKTGRPFGGLVGRRTRAR